MNMRSLLMSLLLTSFSSIVIAQQFPEFDGLDSDGDQYLTDEEVRMNRTLRTLEFDFDNADMNGDGFVDRREYQTYIQSRE